MSHTMTIAAAGIMSLACASCCNSFLAECTAKNYARAFWVKGGAALCFLAVGLLGAIRCTLPGFGLRIVLGLLLGLIGDQLLALRFLRREKHDLYFSTGAFAFALGHAMYVWALLLYAPAALRGGLILTLFLSAASFISLKKHRFDAGRLTVSAYGYIVAVVFMGSLAVAAAVSTRNPGALLFGLGGLCFIVSDNVLCVYSYGSDRRPALNRVIHYTYYAAQLLIGWSLFLIK